MQKATPTGGKSTIKKAAAKKPSATKTTVKMMAAKSAGAGKTVTKGEALPAAKTAAKSAIAKAAVGETMMPRQSPSGRFRNYAHPSAPEPKSPVETRIPPHYAPDARARAILRGIQLTENDLRAAGGTYTLEEVQIILRRVSRQSIAKRVTEGSLLAVPGPNGRRRYPTFQFGTDGSVVDGLKDVVKALPTRNAWAILNFLVNPDAALSGRRPIDLLRGGDTTQVVNAAKLVGDAGR